MDYRVFDTSWSDFEDEALPRLFALPVLERERFLFRGDGNAAYSLQPTIDRVRSFASSTERDSYIRRLIEEFKFQSLGLDFPLGVPKADSQWEFIARHHGLPSAILDWTSSAYVAAFFAFSRVVTGATHVSVWCLDRKFIADDPQARELLRFSEEYADFEYNARAVEQDAVLVRVGEPVQHLAARFPRAISCFRFSASEASRVLGRLAAMRITERALFRDLDSAAKTAFYNVKVST
ncbi:MAG TPA: FRG domain-containing protein [Phycisphaerales bacterium]